ncbi:MAG TPA: choice-of-anchor tandem repeat GloVer-containing protein [Candidatus Cybelea sp.]|jgi:uncharacterized repeat protein (TIGR03803 family)|nr:choice-of-anchor tandem repeat GloVer-containing protein [Candidatus Cybelea sp.]
MAIHTRSLGALIIAAAATTLVACGTLESTRDDTPPIGAPGSVAQGARAVPSSSYDVVHRFSRKGDPSAGLIDVNGTLYGTTYGRGGRGQGTVYSMTLAGVTKTIYVFHGPDGAGPRGVLLDVDGTLYGTTQYGGSSNDGVVFSVTTSGAEKVLYSFQNGSDGAYPYSGLIDVNGTFYGTTYAGGASDCYNGVGCGTVYSVSPSGAETVLHRFSASDGKSPYAAPVDLNGTLYGTTYAGGASNQGVIYAITTSGGERVIYNFHGGSDGAYPKAPLIAVKGTLYGTTYYGGGISNCRADLGCGAVFSIKPNGEEHVLYSFSGNSDGSNPVAPLIDVHGTLYGTTFTGGAYPCGYLDLGCGTIYSLSESGSENVLHAFTGDSDGAFPYAGLVSVGGKLYGDTNAGGTVSGCEERGCGTAFSWPLRAPHHL